MCFFSPSLGQCGSGTIGWSQHVTHTPGDCKNSQRQPTSACIEVGPPTHTSMAAELGQYRNTCEHVARRISPSHPPETPLATLFSFLPAAELSWCSLMFLQGITHSLSPNLCNRYLRSSHNTAAGYPDSIFCVGPASLLNL